VQIYNAMLEGFTKQIDAQLGKRLFTWNEFPGITARPVLRVDPINKIGLGQLAALLGPLNNTIRLGDDDEIAIRKQTGFLPETLPKEEEVEEPIVPETEPEEEEIIPEVTGEEEEPTQEAENEAEKTAETVQQSLIKWHEWTRQNDRATFAELERKA